MRIDELDFFYLALPDVRAIADGSQDVLLVRLRAGGYTGWGECEASPLTSIASLVCPMSHGACKPVAASVLGQPLNDVADIERICNLVRQDSLDLLQARHTLSGIEIAMWDVIGKKLDAPVYELLGYSKTYPKVPYASALFGDAPRDTYDKAVAIRGEGYRAAKFGWGPYGRGTVDADAEQVRAAREGLGPDRLLCVDAGTIWGEDADTAALRLPALAEYDVTWLEEPFVSGAFEAYRQLAARGTVRMAAGEGAHDRYGARHLVDYADIGYLQVDVGRIGGIRTAADVAAYASDRGVQYVNHTFTSQLALAASLHAFAGLPDARLCEYPVEASPLATNLTAERLLPNADGEVVLPEASGLGMTPQPEAVRQYLVDVDITVGGRTLYRTPELAD